MVRGGFSFVNLLSQFQILGPVGLVRVENGYHGNKQEPVGQVSTLRSGSGENRLEVWNHIEDNW